MTDFGAPPGTFPPPPVPPPPPIESRQGPPWEQTGPAVQRYVDTIKGVLLDPVATFRTVRREGGLGPPVAFYVIGALLSVVAQFVWQLAGLGGFGEFGGYGGGAFGALIMGAVVAVLGVFIGSGIIHLVLMLLGGAKFGYETTLRTVAYGFGSAQPIGVVPFCGGIIAAVWGIVVAILGLAQMQDTTTGKAAGAVLIPMVLCCAIIGLAFGAAILAALGFAAAVNN